MKILYFITKSNWGGAGRNVYDLAVNMKAKGHSVIVAMGGTGILRKKLEDEGVKTYSIESLGRDVSISKDFSSFREIWKIIKREKPEVLHLHSPKAAGIGALAGRILRVKKILLTVHGWTFNEDRPFLERLLIFFFSWITALLAHNVIVLSEKEYRQALYFPYVKHKLSIIPSGINPPIFMSIDGARQFFAKTLGIELAEFNKKVVVGTIAELHPNKGLLYLLRAVDEIRKDHPEVLFLMIGDGEQDALLRSTIKNLALEENTRMLGRIDDAAHYLKAMNIFVLPSVKEGLPYTLIEAGFASLPVVATTVGGVPEIIEDMKSGVLVQPKNARELAHSLSFMIEHPSMRKQYGAALRSAVVEKFTIEKMVDTIEKLYS